MTRYEHAGSLFNKSCWHLQTDSDQNGYAQATDYHRHDMSEIT